MELLIDMNLSPKWVDWFDKAGQQSTHWSSIGDGAEADKNIMEYARKHDLVVLTHDLDFGDILAASNRQKPSVIQIRAEDTRPDSIGRTVLTAMHQLKAELARGALLTIEPARSRVRLLPISTDGT